MFERAPRRRGVYSLGGPGVIEFGSPVPEVGEALGKALAVTPVLAWGATAFLVDGVEIVEPPSFGDGRATFRTSTPVVVKAMGREESGVRTAQQTWLLPGERGWDVAFEHGLRRKAETLGLDPDVALERVSWIGPKRSFSVGGSRGSGGHKPGACVEVGLTGASETLRALWSWGLGQANSSGFGWVTA
ncbi:CRISPR-associated protein Cas6 [Actinocorallia sp. API 0066]|uniref:CRISPR-associated endoribonuclease Cas6 n=1 Tax=Actinocorallia sp. API 0066 TaxID=2896846 RepID=UPI001E4D1521|nr:CRISPR-associated endoribonuclease Cas6 [Actinocorallia sp. API 0066]MCD0448856.1 CRISPR-associated protein Cas6 [Actinocorallia sp. API 0066]